MARGRVAAHVVGRVPLAQLALQRCEITALLTNRDDDRSVVASGDGSAGSVMSSPEQQLDVADAQAPQGPPPPPPNPDDASVHRYVSRAASATKLGASPPVGRQQIDSAAGVRAAVVEGLLPPPPPPLNTGRTDDEGLAREERRGTCVVLTFLSPSAVIMDGMGPRVLVAEDDRAIRESLTLALSWRVTMSRR